MTGAAERTVATALAGSFLTGEWTREGLLQSGTITLGRRSRWLPRVVAEVLSLYRDAPADRPRELATVVMATDGFQAAAAAARRHQSLPLRVARQLAAPTRMAASRWPVARLDTVADLANLLDLTVGQLAWYADTAGMQRRTSTRALQLYRYRWLERPGRMPRLLEVPRPRLRRVQRLVLDRIIGVIPAHAAAHGFVPGRNAQTGAAVHVGAAVVIVLDLAGFFAAVSAARIYGILRVAGYPEPVAHLITGLCTTATPIGVLSAMPSAGSIDDRYRLRPALAAPHLPQGAPTSPQLANLAAYRLDCRLAGLAAARGANYTRYADDLVLSGDPGVGRQAEPIVGGVRRIAADEGFRLNDSKTRVQRRGGRQTVTGIVVNARPNVARGEYERLRATLHNAARTGASAQNRSAHPHFKAHLLGRIAWVEALNPGRGRRLRADFDRIDWT